MPSKRKIWSEKRVIEELKIVIGILKHFPTQQELVLLRRSDLQSAIGRINKKEKKNYPYFQNKLGFSRTYLPDGYWTDERILKDLRKVVNEYGRVPSTMEFRKSSYTRKLSAAMTKKGGKNYFLEKLGIKPLQESTGFWTKSETINRLRHLCKKLGYFPTHKEIKKLEGITLSDMVIKHGGSEKLSKELGYPLGYKGKLGGWSLPEVKLVLKGIMIKKGKFPTTSWLQSNGYGGLVASIYSKHGGIEKIARDLGVNVTEHTKGYWSNWENVKKEIRKIMAVTQTFPNYQQIRLLNSKITKGVKYFGGIAEVAKKMGYPPPSQIVAIDGHNLRSSYEFFIDNFLFLYGIKHSVDGYIIKTNSNFRYDFKINNLYIEVWGYPNSNDNIAKAYQTRKQLKEELYQVNQLTFISFYPNDFNKYPKNIEKMIRGKLEKYIHIPEDKINSNYKIESLFHYYGYWTKEKTVKELKNAIQKYGNFPSEQQLRSDRNSSLAFAMNKHGGINHFRSMLGFNIKKHNSKYWTEIEIIRQLKTVIKREGKFPSRDDLIRLNKGRLEAAIAHRGGYKKYQQKLGYQPKHKPDGFYKNKKNVLDECHKIYLRLSHFPNAKELLRLGENSLRSSISRLGGYEYFRNLHSSIY